MDNIDEKNEKDTIETIEDVRSLFERLKVDYNWSLYFFKKTGRKNISYVFQKTKIKGTWEDFVNNLIECIDVFYLKDECTLRKYNGENTKTSLDYIKTDNDILAENYTKFIDGMSNYIDKSIAKDKYTGYLFFGVYVGEDDNQKNITFVTLANPIIKYKKENTTMFIGKNSNLEEFEDDIYRLLKRIDFFIYDDHIYTFNLNFEKLFNVSILKKATKKQVIENLRKDKRLFDVFNDTDLFFKLSNKEKSNHVLLYCKENLDSFVKNKNQISALLGIETVDDKIIVNEVSVNAIWEYLTNRITRKIDSDVQYRVDNPVEYLR